MGVLNQIKKYPLLSLALVLSLILNFYHLDYQSVWLDELHSLNEANPSFTLPQVYDSVTSGEQMPPLYFFLLNIVFKIFGYTAIAGRAFSGIIAIISVYAIYLLGKSLYTRQAGQLAALFLSVNYFHITYAQEMRPYALFELVTIISFYRLVIFIKTPNFKTAMLYGIFTGLLLHTHFIGVFTIAAQCCILFCFLLLMPKEQRKLFIFKAFLAGGIVLLLFLPLLPIFLKVLEIKEFWVPSPKPDIIYLILRNLFGRSLELLLFVVVVSVFFYRKSYKEFRGSLSYAKLLENKSAFNFIILTIWLVVALLLPLIKSYLSASIMLDRYFIGLVPNLLLLFIFGLATMPVKWKKYLTIVFVCYSLLNLAVIKKYYYKISKTQFREVTRYIKKNNGDNAPIISSLSWYYPYFFENEKTPQSILQGTLEEHVAQMRARSAGIKEFWYTDGHNRAYQLSAEGEQFLSKNFVADDIVDFYDCWARHYVLKNEVTTAVDRSKWNNFEPFNDRDVEYKIERSEVKDGFINVSGYAFFKGIDNVSTRLSLVLMKNGGVVKMKTDKIAEEDNLKKFIKPEYLYSTFRATLSASDVAAGEYNVGICIENKEFKKRAFVLEKDKISR